MCGVTGVAVLPGGPAPTPQVLALMAQELAHRGPDHTGLYVDDHVGIACTRLSIVDLCGGNQPIANEDGTIWLVCNGEVYNHHELRRRLLALGHRFRTDTDVEVLLHLYELYGDDLLADVNGEYALAIWDSRERRLLLARDRLGIRPLFYAQCQGALLFGSEVKALLAHPLMRTAIDHKGLDQFFTFWTTVGETTLFDGVSQLLPGHILVYAQSRLTRRSYWRVRVDDPLTADDPAELRDRLADSVALRMRADVPVGVYLSGGLDSAVVAALARQSAGEGERLRTFSISFDDTTIDESTFQAELAASLGTDHLDLRCRPAQIGDVLPEVVRHAEAPLVRTAAAPLFLLSRAVRDAGMKVVLSGEGADEFLLGYDVYRAAAMHRMLAAGHDPPTDDGLLRGVLSDDPYGLRGAAASTTAQLVSTLRGLSDRTDGFFGVHRFRWDRMAGGKAYLAADVRSALAGYDAGQDLAALLPDGFTSADPRHRAQLIDIETLLRGYLLSSQGDRMAMAHSVENRVPFLDHTLVEYLARVPPDAKLAGFVEKKPLRDLFAGVLPPRVLARRKHPYTAPSLAALFEPERDYVTDLLSPSLVARFGIFDPAAVAELVRRCRTGIWPQDHYVSLPVCVLSVQLLCHTFIAGYQRRAALTISYDLVDRRVSHVDGAAADAR